MKFSVTGGQWALVLLPSLALRASQRGFDVATWAFGCGKFRCLDIIFEVATWVTVWEVAT